MFAGIASSAHVSRQQRGQGLPALVPVFKGLLGRIPRPAGPSRPEPAGWPFGPPHPPHRGSCCEVAARMNDWQAAWICDAKLSDRRSPARLPRFGFRPQPIHRPAGHFHRQIVRAFPLHERRRTQQQFAMAIHLPGDVDIPGLAGVTLQSQQTDRSPTFSGKTSARNPSPPCTCARWRHPQVVRAEGCGDAKNPCSQIPCQRRRGCTAGYPP